MCLTEAKLSDVRTPGSGEWSGEVRAGAVIVRGPYKNSGQASGAAHALAGLRGGDYVVYAEHSSRLAGLVSTVASCLGPGTSSYSF
jgi:hypothetical protein